MPHRVFDIEGPECIGGAHGQFEETHQVFGRLLGSIGHVYGPERATSPAAGIGTDQRRSVGVGPPAASRVPVRR